jgi:hypothetical protein
MGDEKRSDNEKKQKSGLPQISAMHVIIAVAVIVLAVIFIAKFGFGMDLISPSSGEMAIVKRPVATPVRTLNPQPPSDIANPLTFTTTPAGVTTTTTWDGCGSSSFTQKRCSGNCVETSTDRANCGRCDNKCPDYQICRVGGCVTPDIFTDVNNCGTIGTVCTATPPNSRPECVKGICTFDCNLNYRFCGDQAEGCIGMYYDNNHCGNCVTKCTQGQWCNETHCDSGPMGNCGNLNCPEGTTCYWKDSLPSCGMPVNSAVNGQGNEPCGPYMVCRYPQHCAQESGRYICR